MEGGQQGRLARYCLLFSRQWEPPPSLVCTPGCLVRPVGSALVCVVCEYGLVYVLCVCVGVCMCVCAGLLASACSVWYVWSYTHGEMCVIQCVWLMLMWYSMGVACNWCVFVCDMHVCRFACK